MVNSGDFEGVLTFGIDIATPFRTVPVNVHLLDLDRFQTGVPPYTRAVSRPVIPPATARGALQRLFAGPTQEELVQRLRFVNSDATGFTALSIVDGVARVRLTGGCHSACARRSGVMPMAS